MNKTELVMTVKEAVPGLTAADAERAVNGVLEGITGALVSGKKVAVKGFGVFEAVGRKQRMCRNPKTGEPVVLPDRRAVKFKPAKALKEGVNGK
ncbi:MAG: HU family DNA-binding protein [Deltaproteobacteria bacterium]|nr:HU family DNA-binding protein [Deltaproteobacteria bacterium]